MSRSSGDEDYEQRIGSTRARGGMPREQLARTKTMSSKTFLSRASEEAFRAYWPAYLFSVRLARPIISSPPEINISHLTLLTIDEAPEQTRDALLNADRTGGYLSNQL
jgi:hypothetical protein